MAANCIRLVMLVLIPAGAVELAAMAAETGGQDIAQTNERAAGRVQSCTGSKDMERSRAWTSQLFSGPTSLPVSFTLDGKIVAGIPAEWEPV